MRQPQTQPQTQTQTQPQTQPNVYHTTNETRNTVRNYIKNGLKKIQIIGRNIIAMWQGTKDTTKKGKHVQGVWLNIIANG